MMLHGVELCELMFPSHETDASVLHSCMCLPNEFVVYVPKGLAKLGNIAADANV